MNASLPLLLKNNNLENDRPQSLDELLNALYWYAEGQAQLAKTRQQPALAEQWQQRVRALDAACQMLDEIDQDDTYHLIY